MRFQLYRDGKRVLECLQRALRVADACMDSAVSIELFVEILNRYVYYFDQQNEAVSKVTALALQRHLANVCPVVGHRQVPQRPHRAHPLQYRGQSGEHHA